MKRFNRGFTLIELLVVIAIIGILSSVVLASLNTARGKGANAAVKANLSGLRATAELYYDNNGNSYGAANAICSGAGGFGSALTAADAAGGGANKCYSDADSWVVVTELKVTDGTSTSFCVDSAGKAIGVTAAQDTAITTANTLCP